jgi:hypothetical protein
MFLLLRIDKNKLTKFVSMGDHTQVTYITAY